MLLSTDNTWHSFLGQIFHLVRFSLFIHKMVMKQYLPHRVIARIKGGIVPKALRKVSGTQDTHKKSLWFLFYYQLMSNRMKSQPISGLILEKHKVIIKVIDTILYPICYYQHSSYLSIQGWIKERFIDFLLTVILVACVT